MPTTRKWDLFMARIETDREDLMREATALRQRAEWEVPTEPEPVVTGFKSDGSLSVYLGQDPVYQFAPSGQLRRAFVSGFLYRTQGDTLARIHRERTDTESTLVRHDLTAAELEDFRSSMRERLNHLHERLRDSSARVVRQVPDGQLPGFADAIDASLKADPWLAPPIAQGRS